MMSPTAVLRDGAPELVLGSAGSNRIRSAILQTIIRVVDDGLPAGDAVRAPTRALRGRHRVRRAGNRHGSLERAGRAIGRFRELNLFFGGVQAVARDRQGRFSGGGDPRRGGAAVVVDAGMRRAVAALLGALLVLAGCGLDVQSPICSRSPGPGQGQKLSLLVNDAARSPATEASRSRCPIRCCSRRATSRPT